MGINRVTKRGKTRIELRKRWPDGTSIRRYFPNGTVAKRLLNRIEVAIADGSWPKFQKELLFGTKADLSIGEYSEHYVEVYCRVHIQPSTCKRKLSSLKHINRLLGKFKMTLLQLADVHRFVAVRLQEEVKAATVNRDVSVLRHMFEFAVEEGAVKANPIARIKQLKEHREERPRVTEEHFQKLLKELSFPIHQMIIFIYETGCRPSEALGLKWKDLNLEKQTAIFNLRKGGDNALVAMSSRAVEAVQSVPQLPKCEYVFWNPKTQTRYKQINLSFQRARERAGIPWIQLKDFRRELGIVIAESGQPLHVAKSQLGHSSIRTTEKFYAHYSPEFAISRAREVMESRGRQMGDTTPDQDPPQNTPKNNSSNVLSFQELRRGVGGGDRTRTGE